MSRRVIPASLLALAAFFAAFAARAEGAWTDQFVELIPEFRLTQSAIQLDLAGQPHVFVGGDRVYHYWLAQGTWHSEIVDAKARSGNRLRVAVGSAGDFHLFYERELFRPTP